MVVVTLDADFHTLLALSGMTGPSVIRIRMESLRGEALAKLLFSVLQICSDDLVKGAMVSVTENGNQNSPAAHIYFSRIGGSFIDQAVKGSYEAILPWPYKTWRDGVRG